VGLVRRECGAAGGRADVGTLTETTTGVLANNGRAA
jgi:hypothetical protein